MVNEINKNEVPPPALEIVAQRIGHDPSHLRKLFPELTRKIVKKRKKFIQQNKQNKIEEKKNEIRGVIHKLSKKEQKPSLRKIMANLSKPGIIRIPDIRNEISLMLEKE